MGKNRKTSEVPDIVVTGPEASSSSSSSPGNPRTTMATEVNRLWTIAEEAGPEVDALPYYVSHRIQLFEKLEKDYNDEVASKRHHNITVSVPRYSSSVAETSWETTPVNIARYLGSQALVDKIVVARVDGELWDLDRPLEKSCKLEFLKFETPEGKATFWKSSAYVLGQAAELRFGNLLCLSEVMEDGFYYEVGLTSSNGGIIGIKSSDQKPLEEQARRIIAAKQSFKRLVVSKDNLLEMFKHSKYKVNLIAATIADGASGTVYRCGSFIDLCDGPHMRDTGMIGVFEIEEKYPLEFRWNSMIDSVRRIYGISIPKKELLEDQNKIRLGRVAESAHASDAEEVQPHGRLTKEEVSRFEALLEDF